MATESPIRDALSRLGSTANEIVESLQIKGIKGRKGQATSCPLANYLKNTFPDAQYVSVGMIIWVDEETLLLPPHVNAFINSFDNDYFPQLDEAHHEEL